MFIPFELAESEPLKELDKDLVETEQQYEENPSRKMLLHYLAVEYFKRGYNKRCMFVCQKLTKVEASRASVWQLLARCQLKLRMDDRARETLQVLEKMPNVEPEIHKWTLKRLKELEPQVQVIDDDEDGPKRGSPLGAVLEQRNIVTYIGSKSDEQVDAVRAQVAEDPDNPELLDWYAFVLYSSERIEEAIEIYERIVKEFTPSDTTYYYLGSAYLKMANVKMAFIYFEALQREYPKSPLLKKIDDKRIKLKKLTKK